VLLGDSTASDCCGWGQGIYRYFKPNVQVVNYGMPWTSTKAFLASAERDNLLVVKPDFVLVQFGYVDSGASGPERFTTLQEFAGNMRTIVEIVRGLEATPILITLHAARAWDSHGEVVPNWTDRNAVVKDVAAELQTDLIDLYELSVDLYSQLGEEGSGFMISEEVPDSMHFSASGAQVISGMIIHALPGRLGPYLAGAFDAVPGP
jgi:lysophospholipase L1-like esterase